MSVDRPDTSVPRDLAGGLGTYRPFDALRPDDLAAAVDAAEVVDLSVGDVVLDAFDRPPTDIVVVLSGEVDVWADADTVGSSPGEKLGRGDAVGFSAALTGRASGPRVVARTPVTIARLPLDVVMPAFASRDGARFLADHISHARRLASGPPMYTVVADLVRTDPLLVDADDPVTDLARKMTERRLPYAAVSTGDGRFGLITDEGLRRRILAEGMPVDSPARAVMAYPAPTTSMTTTSADALIEMLDHDVQFLLVTSADGVLRGAVGERDFVFASTTAGVGINEQIRRAHTIDDLVARARTVPAILADILERGLTADRVIAVNSAIVDSIVRRALTLVFDTHEDLTTDAFTWLTRTPTRSPGIARHSGRSAMC